MIRQWAREGLEFSARRQISHAAEIASAGLRVRWKKVSSIRPEVELASGRMQTHCALTKGPEHIWFETVGVEPGLDDQLRPKIFTSGHGLTGAAGEVVIDAAVAKALHAETGDVLDYTADGINVRKVKVVGVIKRPTIELFAEYGAELMEALRVKATRGKHANVLHHVIGFLKDALEADDKAELLALVDRYRRGLVPLVVPITLVDHHVRRHGAPWVKDQVYLFPHPTELMLRNHV